MTMLCRTWIATLALSVVAGELASTVAAAELRGTIVDAATGKPIAARIYVRRDAGGRDGDGNGRTWHFVRSADERGSAVVYDKTNWINAQSFEKHTTVSAHPFAAELSAGKYTLTVERGKEYFAETRQVELGDEPVRVEIKLRRWANMAKRGWYSGETHIHRPLEELPNILLAEDLNVALPLSYWVTHAGRPPTTGDKNLPGDVPDRLIEVDATHVIWPRNTEYEIFSVGQRRHTLGAIFALNHRSVLTDGVPPVGPMAAKARAEGALFDIDKPDWPWAMSLVPTVRPELFELANNHMWRTEFAFRQFNATVPPFMLPPSGGKSGGEWDWLRLTLGSYYTLLNCGYAMVPAAGTASGVHPVPVGFSRVYVHLPDGFSYERWIDALRKGRSFVTTGPMLLAEVDGKQPGATFQLGESGGKLRVSGRVESAHPLSTIEIIRSGESVKTFFPQNKRTERGAYESTFDAEIACEESGWLAVRCFEDAPGGRVRFAHTAPWHVKAEGKPLRPRREEVEYLVGRMRDEIARGREVLPAAAMAEYERALAEYRAIKSQPEQHVNSRRPSDDSELQFWLENMVWYHGFSPSEIRAATGVDDEKIAAALERFQITPEKRPRRAAEDPLLVLPYPGGRHPRIGFLDGAIEPQRDTKVSVFTPWANETADAASYAVVDVPEAIFSNLGLTYLAHTHVPTIWDGRREKLKPVEWQRRDDGSLDFERTLPNAIAFGTKVVPRRDVVLMELWLRNGTDEKLTDMRVQNCIMLKGMPGFNGQTNANKLIRKPYVACHSEDGGRWIITAWEPCHRPWANPPCPCLHSDPKLPDCAAGETVRVRGAVWFYEGADIDGELRRIEATTWRDGPGGKAASR